MLARIAYGGDIGGISYVVRVEPAWALLAGLGLLVAAVALALAEVLRPERPPAVLTRTVAIGATAFAAWLLLDGHRSGIAIVGAMIVAFLLAPRPSSVSP